LCYRFTVGDRQYSTLHNPQETPVPLVRISLNKTTPEFARGVGDAVHQSMIDTIGIPAEDRFQIITQHEPGELIYDPTFYQIDRSDGFIAVQITLAAGRTREVKANLYRRMTELLAERVKVRPQDVFISLLEVAPEDFSLGNGKAQFADALPPHLQALKTS
jgi:phenylpyruvate tautomerase PptA (4-oxalocrotonate tautomerase family)